MQRRPSTEAVGGACAGQTQERITTALNSDVSADSDPEWVRWVQSVLRVGGFLTTLSGRRHVVYATQDSPISYEQMLALDENNPRRGVMKMVLDQLPNVRPQTSTPKTGL